MNRKNDINHGKNQRKNNKIKKEKENRERKERFELTWDKKFVHPRGK